MSDERQTDEALERMFENLVAGVLREQRKRNTPQWHRLIFDLTDEIRAEFAKLQYDLATARRELNEVCARLAEAGARIAELESDET